jgi:hypothetical protein
VQRRLGAGGDDAVDCGEGAGNVIGEFVTVDSVDL